MTPKQVLDSFSETLMQDERILSAQERALVTALLQHAKTATGQNPDMQEAVRSVIASAVGETVAQRAFAVLGGSIVQRILEGSNVPQGELFGSLREVRLGPPTPVNPGPPGANPGPPGARVPMSPPTPVNPGPPGVNPGPPGASPLRDTPLSPPTPNPGPPGANPGPPGTKPLRDTPLSPPTPNPGPPGATPHASRRMAVSETSVAVSDRPALLPAKCIVLDEFLSPAEVSEIARFALQHEADFSISEVISPVEQAGMVNHDHRRSRVLMDLAGCESLIRHRIQSVLPQVLEELGIEPFAIAEMEAQMTASNDGDFFRFHNDNGSARVSSRNLTFVYFFHREPRQFEGGELRIHDSRLVDGTYVSEDRYQTIIPRQNQIVFFAPELMHEITPVRCPSRHFADSRFTLNGWLRR